jgi:hypothetical protein
VIADDSVYKSLFEPFSPQITSPDQLPRANMRFIFNLLLALVALTGSLALPFSHESELIVPHSFTHGIICLHVQSKSLPPTTLVLAADLVATAVVTEPCSIRATELHAASLAGKGPSLEPASVVICPCLYAQYHPTLLPIGMRCTYQVPGKDQWGSGNSLGLSMS